MAIIRHIDIKNFRSIKEISWFPKNGLNCLIGPGDSGKSTILDAIDLTLGARRSFSFNDADFYKLNTNNPIVIQITLGELDDNLKNIEIYGNFLRGFDKTNKRINDEPLQGDEIVLTLQLTIREDLEPDWLLYSNRAHNEGIEKRLQWKHREQLTPARLGTTAYQHLAFGNRSILNKLSEDTFDQSLTLAKLGRQTRQDFNQRSESVTGLTQLLIQTKQIANRLGVPVGELKALLDVNGISLSNGAISLHNDDDTPLRQLGTGSSRLLISGLHKAANKSKIIIIDEVEYGLEPYRITRLLNELGSKENSPSKQVFITTHSPYVLKELQAQQLHVLRTEPPSHNIYYLEDDNDTQQSTLRACAEAFFSKAVIVGEGKTEIGLVRGLESLNQNGENKGIQSQGVFCTDGGGDSLFQRAEVFASLGYPTALLKDSDLTHKGHNKQSRNCRDTGVTIFEWGNELSTEGALLTCCPLHTIPTIISLAIRFNGEHKVKQDIQKHSGNTYRYEDYTNSPEEAMRIPLASAVGKGKWFKNISKAEALTIEIIASNYQDITGNFKTTIDSLLEWVNRSGDRR
ncbi:ATP-dependent nuclease [Arsenophonus nasoniae]|uniref:AAA family ATPase n=1 Tax=Arsenophonus nasoniae TaxID=638 RepID=A0AA95GCU8_9GAMM|nr:AAA family ATPase [Arsenophonus nasoniae]WGL95872.1 AAA family ATPase [Arsenophonus nasoniae]